MALEFRIHVKLYCDSVDSFVCAFLPKPFHTSKRSYTCRDRDRDGAGCLVELKLDTPAIDHGTPVGFHVFTHRDNYARHDGEYRAGQIYIPIEQLIRHCKPHEPFGKLTVPIYHTEGDVQGSLTLYNLRIKQPIRFTKKTFRRFKPPHPYAEVRTPNFEGGGLPPSCPYAQYNRRTFINYMRSHLPVWMFPLMNLDFETSDEYLEHVIRIVLRQLFISEEDYLADPTAYLKYFRVLVDVLGFISWKTRYLHDEKYDPETGKFVPSDQFDHLAGKPSIRDTVGDCEDFSKQIQIEWMHLIRRDASKSPLIACLQRVAIRYCLFTMDATINPNEPNPNLSPYEDTDDTACLHMYIVIIPWARVLELLGVFKEDQIPVTTKIYDGLRVQLKAYDNDAIDLAETYHWPFLSLESTDLNVGVFEESNRPELIAAEAFLEQYKDAADNGYNVKGLSDSDRQLLRKTASLIRIIRTANQFKKDDFYRLDLCAYSRQLYDLCGVTFVAMASRKRTGKWEYGVPKFEFADFMAKTRDLPNVDDRDEKFQYGLRFGPFATDAEKNELAVLERVHPQPLWTELEETVFNEDVKGDIPLRNGKVPAVIYVREQDLPDGALKRAFESFIRAKGWEFKYERMHVAGRLYSHVYYIWKR